MELHLQARMLLDLLLLGIMGDADANSTTASCTSLDEMATFIVDSVQGDQLDVDVDTTNESELSANMTAAIRAQHEHARPERDASSSSGPPRLRSIADTTAYQVATAMQEYLMQTLMNGILDDPEQTLRETVKHMIVEVQRQSFRLQALFSLLADLLPKPTVLVLTGTQVRGGAARFAELLQMLD